MTMTTIASRVMLSSLALLAFAGCAQVDSAPGDQVLDAEHPGADEQALTASKIKHVFVIAMENHAASQIYGSASAPYITNTLLPSYGHATAYADDLPALPSEPHYVWLEAGTNAFSDHTFTGDSAPSASNNTGSTAHLVTQIKNASNGVSWRSYQEGLNAFTGMCPVAANGFYAPKHDPFVFFEDVSGATPSKTNAYCAAHHKALSALSADLGANAVATYNFITPNLCHDMHGATGCADSNGVRAGDTWLGQNLPQIISYAKANAGVILIVWDEPETSGTMPFLVIGPNVKPNHASSVSYTHSSVVKSLERIMELPILPTVSSANDFSDFFTAGSFP
jgi:phosphatidylinositol-3-phosphatase